VHLVPESAIVDQTAGKPRTFGDMRQAMVLKSQTKYTRVYGDDPNNNNEESQDNISIGCGFTVDNMEPDSTPLVTNMNAIISTRRRLTHVENAGACNNLTNFYCWMSCLDIPNANTAQAYVSENYGLYCLDPAVLAATGQVSKAVEPCNQAGITGLAMNTNCLGMWQPQVPNVPPQQIVIVNASSSIEDEPFCYGGTSMYMEGFQWLGSTCAIYLFPSLVLDSPGSLVLACFATIAFGMALEWVILRRRITVKQCAPGMKRLVISAGFYAVQLTMGYAIMLVVMTYSIPLFVSVVAGIVGGHIMFSAPDALIRQGRSNKKESKEHESDSDSVGPEGGKHRVFHNVGSSKLGGETFRLANGSDEQRLYDSTGEKAGSDDSDGFDPEVPEGSTPCCQNQL
jgi:Ctr copper transporter family